MLAASLLLLTLTNELPTQVLNARWRVQQTGGTRSGHPDGAWGYPQVAVVTLMVHGRAQ
jgi:hypothetical protein